jgi:hypothetical protein
MRPVVMNKNIGTPLEMMDFYTEVNSKTGKPRYEHVYKPRMLEILKHISNSLSVKADVKARALALYIELKD